MPIITHHHQHHHWSSSAHLWTLRGLPISGVAEADTVEGVKVYHAGTKQNESSLVTSGGAHRALGAGHFSAMLVEKT